MWGVASAFTVGHMTRGYLRLVTPSRADARASLRVLLLEDHPRLRQRLAAVLGDYVGVEVAQDRVEEESILRRVRYWKPDVVFLAVRSGGSSGMELLAHLHEHAPDTPIVVLTMQRSTGLARHALERGATGVVLKDHADSELMAAARAVVGGRTFVSPVITG